MASTEYTQSIIDYGNCNYLDAQNDNSSSMLLSCINYNSKPASNQHNTDQPIIEGFSSDMGGAGVHYVPLGECPVGYLKKDNMCHKSYLGSMPNSYYSSVYDLELSTPLFNHCKGGGTYLGIDENGYIKCKKNETGDVPAEEEEDENIVGTLMGIGVI